MGSTMEFLNSISVGNLITAGVILTTIGAVVRKAVPPMRRILSFVDDVQGEQPRPGLPHGRPGIMERLAKVEENTQTAQAESKAARDLAAQAADVASVTAEAVRGIDAKVTRITKEFDNNGGTSTLDLLTHIAEAVGAPTNTPVAPEKKRGPL